MSSDPARGGLGDGYRLIHAVEVVAATFLQRVAQTREAALGRWHTRLNSTIRRPTQAINAPIADAKERMPVAQEKREKKSKQERKREG